MKSNDVILKRQKYNTRFKNEDMDFMFNWMVGISHIIGLAPSQVFHTVYGMKEGDTTAWRDRFRTLGHMQRAQAHTVMQDRSTLLTGQLSFGAAYAYRAALQYTSPALVDFSQRVKEMEDAFQQGVSFLGVPLRSIEVPFEQTTLPGYYLEHDQQLRPVIVMIGGGDTFREDLFYFAGYPGWKRGYNVLMVDLPGQGITPNRGQHFQIHMDRPIRTLLDWLETHAAVKPKQIAIYGVSGGGYFTAQAVATDPRICAWIASTPITDIANIFRREFGPALATPGWVVNTYMQLASTVNKSAQLNLEKYAWQFGTADFKQAIARVYREAQTVDTTAITCPSLFLMSEGEGQELRRQTMELHQLLQQRGVDVTLRSFTAAEGADGHCQVNNLRLAHMVIFDWLDRVLQHESGDIRYSC